VRKKQSLLRICRKERETRYIDFADDRVKEKGRERKGGTILFTFWGFGAESQEGERKNTRTLISRRRGEMKEMKWLDRYDNGRK